MMWFAQVPTREEFLYQTPVTKALFYVLILGSLAFCIAKFWSRRAFWQKGKLITWPIQPLTNFRRYVLEQRKVRSSRPRSGSPMHLAIFYGFLSLVIATTLLAINTYSPFKFHSGTYFLIFEAAFDSLGLLLLIGVTWAAIRRFAFRTPALSQQPADWLILLLLFALTVTGYLVEGARIAVTKQPFDHFSWVGNLVAGVLGDVGRTGFLTIWWVHAILVATFFVSLPYLKLRHLVGASISAIHAPDVAMGRLTPLSMEEVEQTGLIGATQASDFTQWHLMAADACMECGRCTEVCPAHGVGKALNPKQIVSGLKQATASNQPLAEVWTDSEIWACTTCNACVEACPVLIRHVDFIVDARRNLVAEGKLSGSAATMLRQVGSTSNAWGVAADTREDWMRDRDIPLARNVKEFDVLLWVGCAGATDPGAVKTTQATAELLKRAGVSFACLGREELCTGDSARRVGDEFLFQEMVQQNLAVLGQYSFKRIVAPCPHCLNTLLNEYPDFGGKFEVVHHTQFIQELIATGKLRPADNEKITYHDPCYLGRVNNEQEAPRNLLRRRDLLAEPEHHGKKTLCCGAGGGRMWMEEGIDERPGVKRAEELLASGAETVAVACPFCRIMLDASVKQVTEKDVRIIDLAELVAEANR